MLEILQFVFSSFWVWLGSMAMLTVVCDAATKVFGGGLLTLDRWVRRG